MTTIATDGTCMASDSRACRCDIVVSDQVKKIVRLKDGSLLGLAGRSSTMPKLAAWLDGGGAYPEDEGDWSALVLRDDGCRYYSNDQKQAYHTPDIPAAIGTGHELATGAMLAGADPATAVGIAAKRDPFTGGTITTLELKP